MGPIQRKEYYKLKVDKTFSYSTGSRKKKNLKKKSR